MKRLSITKVSMIFAVVITGIWEPLYPQTCSFSDDFGLASLDATKWDTFNGAPLIQNEKLVLISDTTGHVKTEVQSKIDTFLYGTLNITAGSSHWESDVLADSVTDTSIGFEIYYKSTCHDGIVITNGTLGILRSFPGAGDTCIGDPKFQRYFTIPYWNVLRKTVNKYTIVWQSDTVELIINDTLIVPHDPIPYDSVPNYKMRIRFNCNVDLKYNHGITKDTLFVDSVCFKPDTLVPLPVELAEFTAKVRGESVELWWKTATEVNNHGFEIERTAVGKFSTGWNTIGFVAGWGTSNSPHEYTYVDQDLLPGKYLYRLKQTDNDGAWEYSERMEIEVSPQGYSLSQNFPNPFNPVTTIRYIVPEKSRVRIEVLNTLGQKVATLVNGENEKGPQEVRWNAGKAASGVYFYRLTATPKKNGAKTFVQVKQMQLLK